ncbi:hypothetical protein MBLNU13_g03718t1 [Cladosporium sp. NU13]
MIMEELIKFVAETGEIPKHGATSIAYNSAASSNPLRTLLRDYWVYQMPADGADHLKASNFPKDFLQDIATELMLLKLGETTTKNVNWSVCSDKCLYHQHDDEHLRCGAQ